MKNYLLFTLCLLSTLSARSAYIPVSLSGFNQDIIANGVGNASASTTAAVDLSNWDLVSADFQATSSSSYPSAALPSTGVINSVNTTGLTFQLAGYGSNNGLVITTLNGSGTLTFGTVCAGDIYVLGFGGNGANTASITVTFTDNTTQTFSNVTFDDWYGGSGYAIQGIGRVNRTSNALENPTGDPRLYERKLTLSSTNNTKQIASITVTKTSSAGVLNIVAVSVDNLCSVITGLNASSVTGNTANLSWNAISGVVGYEYVLDQTAANPSGPGTNTTSTFYNATGLNTSTTYYMHVRTKCTSITYANWTTISFTTLNSPVTCSTPGSFNLSNLTSSSVKLNWNAVPASVGYEYKVDQSSGNPTTWSTTFINSAMVTGLTGGTGYYAHLRNLCSPTDKSNWLTIPFATLTCNKPVTMLISNVTETTADLLWSQMPNAVSYDYAVDFSNLSPVAGIKNTTGITVNLTSLIPNSKYYIHVRTRCFTTDTSGWRLDSFITKSVCYQPNVQVNDLGTDNPYAFWAAVPTAIAYEYALTHTSKQPAFGTEIPNTFVALTLPADGADYYLHVRSKCNSQFTFSPWSTVTLRLGTNGVNDISNGEIRIYPNPVGDVLHIDGFTSGAYSITDITGRRCLSGRLTEAHTTIQTSSFARGMYLLRIRGDIEHTYRFIKE